MGTGAPLPLTPHEMQTVRSAIKSEFHNLADSFQLTSWPTEQYNCIAWAAEDQGRWWWPDIDGESFWPQGIERNETILDFITAFRTLGYETCESHDLEIGYEKVAIFAIGDRVKHMGRQLSSGAWTSKLGPWWDVGHDSVDEIEAPHYGRRVQILKRTSLNISIIPSGT